jgi:hypothetical protein
MAMRLRRAQPERPSLLDKRGGRDARLRLFAALAIALGVALPAAHDDNAGGAGKRQRFTKRATVAQSGATEDIAADGAPITDPDAPFSFGNVRNIRKLTRVTLTATIADGDTGPDEIDEGDLTLVLDGIDTGLVLDGFRGIGELDTLTISGKPKNQRQIRAALKADGALVATIRDADPTDEIAGNPFINFIEVPGELATTLVLTGKRR